MVGNRETSHIIMDLRKFKQFNDKFQPEKHYIELAAEPKRVALRTGDAELYLIDKRGTSSEDDDEERLTYTIVSTEHFFSVKAATAI